MDKQVNYIVKSYFMSFRDMYKVNDCLPIVPIDTRQTVLQAFIIITSRLDYCNSTLYGMTTKQTSKLQGIQNTAADVITYV